LDGATVGSLFGEGVEQSYAIQYSAQASTLSGQPMTQMALRGSVRVVGVQTAPTQVVSVTFDGTLGELTGADAGAVSADLAEAVRRPFLLEFTRDGRFSGARGDAGTPAFVGRLWSALGEYLQLRTPAASEAKATRWEATEADSSGEYVAAYEEQADGAWQKRKLRYDKLTPKEAQRYDVVSSDVHFQRERGFLKSLHLAEVLRAQLGAGSPVPGFESSVRLDLERTSGPAPVELSDASAQPGAVSLKDSARRDQRHAEDLSMAAGMTVAETLDRLGGLGNRTDAGHVEKDRAGRAYVALTALLRTDPKALTAVRANLRKGGPLDVSLLAALRDASTPQTQGLLVEMSRDGSPLDDEERLEAARCLSRVPTPTADTVAALKDLRSDPVVGTQASYGLGSTLHSLQGENGEVAEDARRALSQQLAGATSPGDQSVALIAMGNAGDSSMIDQIRAMVTSDSAAVRAAAAQALRRIPLPAADELLAQLCSDPAADVRASAVDAIRERAESPLLVPALTQLALREAEDPIRARAVNVLAQWIAGQPAIATTLSAVAKSDGNADIRNVAKNALLGNG
jgi:hypothetical protein